MTLTIHIGMPKTGTTTIQQALHDNWGTLSERGIDYLLRPEAPLGDHVHLASSLGFGGPVRDGEEAATYRAMLARRDPARHAILSTEHFSFFWSDPSMVHRLREVTGPARIVTVLRNQVDWMPSMYGEGLKRGRQRTFEQVAKGMVTRCDYERYLTPYAEAYGADAIDVLVYEEGDVLDQFCERVLGEGADEMGLVRPPRANATPPQLLLEAVRRLGIEDRETCYRVYHRALDRASRAAPLGKFDMWPVPKALRARMDDLKASNGRVARCYLDRDALFPQTLEEYAARYEERLPAPDHAETAAALVTALIADDAMAVMEKAET